MESTENILYEDLTPSEKVDAWNAGTRIVRVGACSDAKLRLYASIADQKGYSKILNTINLELKGRGSVPYIPKAATQKSASTTSKAPSPIPSRDQIRIHEILQQIVDVVAPGTIVHCRVVPNSGWSSMSKHFYINNIPKLDLDQYRAFANGLQKFSQLLETRFPAILTAPEYDKLFIQDTIEPNEPWVKNVSFSLKIPS